MLEVKAICEDCKEKFKVNSETISKTTFKTNDGKIVDVVHYECPKCGRVHYVQIDDENTKRLLENSKVVMKQAMVYYFRKQTPPKKIKTKLEKIKKKISSARLQLMKDYNNTVFVDLRSKEEVNMHFSL